MKVKGSLYWIYSFTSGCKGKMLVAILLAVIGVLCGMAPYFALAGILSGLIQNTLTAERIFCYVGIAVLGETLKMLFNTVSSLKAHRVAYHILGNIRCKLAEKMMRVPMGVMVDTPSGKLKAMVVDTVDKLEQPLAHMLPEIITFLLFRNGLICHTLYFFFYQYPYPTENWSCCCDFTCGSYRQDYL